MEIILICLDLSKILWVWDLIMIIKQI